MKSKLRFFFLRIHFGALALCLVNYFIQYITKFGLSETVEFVVALTIVISAIVLFFLYRKPFARINYYFSLYVGTLSLIIATTLLNGFLGIILIHMFVVPLIPLSEDYRQQDIIFYRADKGFMAACCTYTIKERYWGIFEKDLGTTDRNYGLMNLESIDIQITETEVILSYETGVDDLGIQKIIAPR